MSPSQKTAALDDEGSDPSTPASSAITPENSKTHGRLELIQLTDQTNLLPFRKILTVFLGLSVCIVITTLDQTLVATALPSITSAFHAGMFRVLLVHVKLILLEILQDPCHRSSLLHTY